MFSSATNGSADFSLEAERARIRAQVEEMKLLRGRLRTRANEWVEERMVEHQEGLVEIAIGLYDHGERITDIARAAQVSRVTIYKWLEEHRAAIKAQSNPPEVQVEIEFDEWE